MLARVRTYIEGDNVHATEIPHSVRMRMHVLFLLLLFVFVCFVFVSRALQHTAQVGALSLQVHVPHSIVGTIHVILSENSQFCHQIM